MSDHYLRRAFRKACITTIPRSQRFHALLIYCRFAAWVESKLRPPAKRTGVTRRLDIWMLNLEAGGPFDVPTSVVGLEQLRAAYGEGRGVLVCYTHIPLYSVVLTGLKQADFAPDYVIAHPTATSEGVYVCLGSGYRCPAIVSGPNCLLEVRTALMAGKLIACVLDAELGEPLNANFLRLAAKVKASVFVVSMKLGRPAIQVEIRPAPHALQRGETDVEANLAALEATRQDWVSRGDLEAV